MSVGPEGGRFAGSLYQPASGHAIVAEKSTTIIAGAIGQLLVAVFGPVRERAARVFRLSLNGPNALCAAGVYVGSELTAADFIDGTSVGSYDEGTYHPPITVQEGQSLYVAWSPTPAGQTAAARVEYTEVSR